MTTQIPNKDCPQSAYVSVPILEYMKAPKEGNFVLKRLTFLKITHLIRLKQAWLNIGMNVCTEQGLWMIYNISYSVIMRQRPVPEKLLVSNESLYVYSTCHLSIVVVCQLSLFFQPIHHFIFSLKDNIVGFYE